MTRLKYLIIALVVVTVSLYLRALLESRNALINARRKINDNQFIEAIADYSKAVGWFSPGNPYNEKAATEGLSVIHERILTGEGKLAALRELRRGFYGSRNLFNSHSEMVTEIDSEIKSLIPESERLKGIDEITPPKVDQSNQVLVAFSFIAWIAAACATIWNGFTPQGSIKWKNFVVGGVICSATFLLWVSLLSLHST